MPGDGQWGEWSICSFMYCGGRGGCSWLLSYMPTVLDVTLRLQWLIFDAGSGRVSGLFGMASDGII